MTTRHADRARAGGTRRLLGVFAHPDDETFGPGATLAVHSAGGVDVHIATMTDGVAGAPAPGYPDGPALAAIRAQELKQAVDVLGGTAHPLGYRDSGFTGDPRNDDPDAFMNVDPEGPVQDLVALIRELRPDVVISHDVTGGYFHPDHIRTHHLVREAFFAAGDPDRLPDAGPAFAPARWYSEVRSNKWIKRVVRVMPLFGKDPTRIGVNNDVDLTNVGVDPATITTRIDVREGWAAKQEAARCHASQRGGTGWMNRLPPAAMARLMSVDTYVREYPAPWPGLREHSLFG